MSRREENRWNEDELDEDENESWEYLEEDINVLDQ